MCLMVALVFGLPEIMKELHGIGSLVDPFARRGFSG